MATNIGNASAALAQGGNTYEEVLALMTGIVEITRSGAKASRGLVSIQSRYNQLVDESSDTGKALSEWYEKHNIAIYDQAGQLRKLYSVLGDVAKIWPNLTKNERAYYLNQQAGANQTQNLAAVLQNMDHVTKAYNLAINSSGSAMAENEKAVASLEGQTNLLKAEFQDLANNVIPNELIKELLKLGSSLLELINNPVGQFIIRWGLVAGVVSGAGTVFVLFAQKIIPMVVSGLGTLTAAGVSAQVALGFIPLAIGAVVAAIPYIIDAFNDSSESVKELNEELQTMSQQLDDNKKRIEEINGLSWTERTADIDKEYYALLRQNDELERGIKLRRSEIKAKSETDEIQVGIGYKIGSSLDVAETLERISNDIFTKYQTQIYATNDEKEKERLQKEFRLAEERLNKWKSLLSDTVFASYEEAMSAINSYDWFAAGWQSDAIDDFRNKLSSLIEEQYQYKNGIAAVTPELEKYNKILEKNGELTVAQKEDFNVLMDSASDYYDSLKQLQMAGVSTDEQNEFIENYEKLNKIYSDATNATNNFGISLNKIKESAPELYSYMENNGFTVKAFSDYCVDAKINALDLAKSLAIAADSWTTYGQAAAAGLANVMTEAEFARHTNTRKKYGTYANYLAAMQEKYKGKYKEEKTEDDSAYKSFIDKLREYEKTSSGGGDKTTAQKRLEKFNEALKLLDHQLAMDQISTEEYYASLQKLMDTYLQDAENQETLWKYQEKIYSWKKKAAEDEQSAQEKINSELQKQIELQEKLRDAAEALAKAQQKRILVFRKSGYGYMQDVGAISEAQAAYAKVKSGYAGGTVYSSAGLHMFGENGPELGVIGSGNGVLPSEITRNLWEWGAQRPEEVLSGVPASGGDTISFSGVTMAFPNVRSGSDAQGFMESLVMLARQRAYKRY